MTKKARVHQLVDTLSKQDLKAIEAFLCRLQATEDPVDRVLLRASLLEPETLSPEDEAAMREAEEAVAAGQVISHEELLRRLGPT